MDEVNDYIKTSYEEFHVQVDEANILDIEEHLRRKGALLKGDKTIIDGGKYEYTMQLLAAMASINIARQQKISRNKAFFRFMKSNTAQLLFDADTDFWMNGPDYIADEYRREKGL